MEYLAFEEVITKKKDIADELDLLLSNKALVAKPNALQWKFVINSSTMFIINRYV